MAEENPEPINVGSIPAAGNSEIRFYVSKYKGRLYAHIRKFVKTESYSGPTQSGVTMTREAVDTVRAAVAPLNLKDPVTDKELARLPRGPGLELVVRLSLYKEKSGIDFREWVTSPSYTGWSKKGVRLSYEHLPQIKDFLDKMGVFFRKEG